MLVHERDLRAIAQRYKAGASIRQLAKQEGVTYPTVRRWLKLLGVQLRRRGGPNNRGMALGRTKQTLLEHREEIQSMTVNNIRRRFGFDASNVYRALRELNLRYRRLRSR